METTIPLIDRHRIQETRLIKRPVPKEAFLLDAKIVDN